MKKNHKTRKRILALMLSLTLIITYMPTSVFAFTEAENSQTTFEQEDVTVDPAQDVSGDSGEVSTDGGNQTDLEASEPEQASAGGSDSAGGDQPDTGASAADSETVTSAGGDAEYVVSKDELEAAKVQGQAAASEKAAAEALEEEGIENKDAKRLAKSIFADAKAEPNDTDFPRERDGSTIEDISAAWVIGTDISDDPLLVVTPKNDNNQTIRLQINYSLSGEHNYDAGDVTITVPSHIFKDRNGNDYGNLIIPYPEDPSMNGDFNWKLEGNNYILTNTRTLKAATKGFIQFDITGLYPHALIDMMESNPFSAYIQVLTHLDNTIALRSNEITAKFDTEARLTSVTKRVYGEPEVVDKDVIPASQRIEGVEQYVKVVWYITALTKANTYYTMSYVDTMPGEEENADGDKYRGFIIGGTPDSEGNSVLRKSVYNGYASNRLFTYTVTTAYPVDEFNNFEEEKYYTFHNNIEFIVSETDPDVIDENGNIIDERLVTRESVSAETSWNYAAPEHLNPTGHYMVFKNGNDDTENNNSTHKVVNGKYTTTNDIHMWYRNYEGWYGSYSSALNDMQDIYAEREAAGKDPENGFIRLSYTIDSIGYVMPWLFDKNSYAADSAQAPRNIANYTRSVELTTNDYGISIGRKGSKLKVGDDYKFISIEFPADPYLYRGIPNKINEDGSWYAKTYYDGTFLYNRDNNRSNWPDITLQVLRNGEWEDYAVASWKTGSFIATLADGSTQTDRVIDVPEDIENFRTVVTMKNTATKNSTTQAAIDYDIRVVIGLKTTESMIERIEEEFSKSNTPKMYIYNRANITGVYGDKREGDPDLIVSIGTENYDADNNMNNKDGYNVISGYNVDTMVYPTKTSEFDEEKDVDADTGLITVHYSAKVEERSFVNSKKTYEEAVEDDRIKVERSGVWRDLLPKGMTPVLSTVKLRENDSIRDIYTIPNYRGTGRTLLVVEADLVPKAVEYKPDGSDLSYWENVPSITFDATLDILAAIDYGYFNPETQAHNVVSFESGNDALGSVDKYKGEPNDPYSNNNVATKGAFDNNAERDALRNVSDRTDPSFVYAGDYVSLNYPGKGISGLVKYVQVNNDGLWSSGLYNGDEDREANERVVYTGGTYSYLLRYMPENTDAKNVILYDSLENFYAGKGNREIDIDAPRWQGTFAGVETSQLERAGIAPVVYYSAVENLQLSDETDPQHAVPVNMGFNDTTADGTRIWYEASEFPYDLSEVKAIAIDASKDKNGNDYTLIADNAIQVEITMRAPQGEDAELYIKQDAHAYNNAYVKGLEIDHDTHIPSGKELFDHYDYTKVGLTDYFIKVTKLWDDDDNRDGKRPNSVDIVLLGNGKEVARTTLMPIAGPDGAQIWPEHTFTGIPYTDPDGNPIHYTITEDPVPEGYTPSIGIVEDEDNSYTVTNRHVPEKVSVDGNKIWSGDEEQYRPEYIRVKLLANGEVIKTQTVKPNGAGYWAYSFGNLNKYENGQEIVYTIEEERSGQVLSYSESYDGYDIINTYHPYGDLYIEKTIENVTPAASDKEFTFTVTFTRTVTDDDGNSTIIPVLTPYSYDVLDESGEVIEDKSGIIVSGGSITIKGGQKIHIKEIDQYVDYEVEEDGAVGFTLSSADGENGRIAPNETSNASFVNRYSTSGRVDFKARKTLHNKELLRYKFHFEVWETDEKGADIRLIRTASNTSPDETAADDDGNIISSGPVSFGAIRYSQEDDGKEFTYHIYEQLRDGDGYIYDESMYTAIVSVNDIEGNGTMTCSVRYYKDGKEVEEGDLIEVDQPVFENYYEANGGVQFRVWKDLKGRKPEKGEFNFMILDETGRPVKIDNETGRVSVVTDEDTEEPTVTYNDDTGAAVFPEIRFDQTDIGKTYYFAFKEIIPEDENKDTTVTYDTKVYGYKVTISDNGDGTLSIAQDKATPLDAQGNQVKQDEGGNVSIDHWTTEEAALPVFTNTLEPGGLSVTKLIDNPEDADPSQRFHFIVRLIGDGIKDGAMEYDLEQVGNSTAGNFDDTDDEAIDDSEEIAEDTEVEEAIEDADKEEKVSEKKTGSILDRVSDLIGGPIVLTAYGADDDIASGTYDEVDWRITSEGELIIGNGATQNYVDRASRNATSWPWYSYASRIKTVRFDGIVRAKGSMSAMFSGCTALTSIDLTGFDTTGATSLAMIFYRCMNLTSLDLSTFDTQNVTAMGNMFGTCSKLASVIFGDNFDTGKVTSFYYMFEGCSALESIDISNFDTHSATNMEGMFRRCGKITELEFGDGFDTSKVTTMTDMFQYCSSLQSLDLSGFDTGSLKYVRDMFQGCASLTSLDISGIDFSRVTDVSYLLSGCRALTDLNMSGVDFSNVTTLYDMFENCTSLKNIDMSGLDTRNVTSMSSLFYGCTSLERVNLSGMDTSKVTSLYGMFYNCSSLKSVDLSDMDTSNVTSTASMFSGCSSLTDINFTNFVTANVTNMSGMFSGCSSLTEIDLSNFATANVTNMSNMFNNCSSVRSIDVSRFNTSKVTNMSYMFSGSGITGIDVSGFDTSAVTNMQSMFSGCSALTELDLRNFNTLKVTTMQSMFSNCSGLADLKIGSFDTSNVTSMMYMFSNCSGLTGLDLTNFDTSKVTNMCGMFSGCSGLTSINLSSFNTEAVSGSNTSYEGFAYMFQNCKSLQSIDLSSFRTPNVKRFNYMFAGCSGLTELDLSNFETSAMTGLGNMFENCSNLEILDISNFDCTKVGSSGAWNAFTGANKICRVNLGPKFMFKYAVLPSPPRNDDRYTGYWIREDEAYGPYFSSTLSSVYNESMAGIWIWEETPTQYTLSFAGPEEASGSMDTVKVTATEDYTIPACGFYWFNHELDYWDDGRFRATYSDKDTIPANKYAAGDKITLTAHFKETDTTVNVVDGQFDLYLYGGEKATFKDLPAGTVYQVWEETPDGWVLISQSNTSGTIEPIETANAVFTNRYQPGTVTAQFQGTKMLDNTAAAAGAFSFTLTEKDNENGTVTIINEEGALEEVALPITVTTLDGGFVQFPIIQYAKEDAGKHTYIITEVDPNLDTIDYDTHKETVTVAVTENEDGSLSAEKVYDNDGIRFVNKTRPGNLKINKIGENPTEQNADDEFTFRVTFRNENGQPIGEDNEIYWYVEGRSFLGKVKNFFKSLIGGDKEKADSDKDSQTGSLLDKISDAFGGPLVLTAYGAEDDIAYGTYINVDWRITSNGELIIGNGGEQTSSVRQWSPRIEPFPWEEYGSVITAVKIDGIVHMRGLLDNMFKGCKATTMDLNGLDTSQGTSMASMFSGCGNLTELDLSNFDTSNVTYMGNMFESCIKLESVDVSSFDTSNVTTFSDMFYNCWELKEIDVSHFDTSKGEYFFYMFWGCMNLKELNLSNFDTSQCTIYTANIDSIFGYCPKLEKVDIRNMDTSNFGMSGNFFYLNNSLREITLGPKFTFKPREVHQALLPTPPTTAPYTGEWVRVDGMFKGTPEWLAWNYDGQSMYGTYVWAIDDTSGRVFFDANGGYTDQTDIVSSDPAESITMPDMSNTRYLNYILTGWNTEKDGSGINYHAGQTYTDILKIGETVTLYAQWDMSDNRIVTVDHYQQNTDLTTYSLADRDYITGLPGSVVEAETKDYKGFVTPDKVTVTIAEDNSAVVEYYYDRKQYKVTFDGNGASLGSMEDLQMISGIEVRLPEANFFKTGSLFVGWNTKPDGSGVSFTNMQQVTDVSDDGSDITLYAIWMDNPNPILTPTDGEVIVKCKAGETIVIPELPAGTTYTIEELDNPSGWYQEGTINENGFIVSNETVTATVNNAYYADGYAVIEAEKRLEGRAITDGDEFTFMLYDQIPTFPNPARPIDTKTTDSVDPVTGTAGVVFDTIDYTEADIGVHTYYIIEGGTDDPDIICDSHIETVTVTVSDAVRTVDEETGKRTGGGTLDVKVEYDSDGPLFTNIYEKIPGDLSITKNITDGSPEGTPFRFKVEFFDAEGNELTDIFYGYRSTNKPGDNVIDPGDPIIGPIIGPIRPKDKTTDITNVKDDSSKDKGKPDPFDPIIIIDPDEIRSGDIITLEAYETIVIEGLPAGTTYRVTELGEKGWTLVNSANTSGTIVSDTTREAVFTNSYYAEEEVTFTADKEFKGGTLEDGMFEFGIFQIDEDGIETLISSSFNDAEGHVDFAPLTYTFADDGETYHYVIREIAYDTAGITFDSGEYEVTVSVEDAGDGTLKVTTTGDYEHMKFINTVSTALELTKKLDGYVDAGEMSNVTLAFEVKGYNFIGEGDDMTEKEAYSNYIGVTFSKDDVDSEGNYTKTVFLKDLPYCDRYEVTEVYSGNYTPGDMIIEYDEAEQIWRAVADNSHSGYTPGSGVVNKYENGSYVQPGGNAGDGGEPSAGGEGN